MYLQCLQIINFKSFRNATFNFDEKLNVFTGINNSGKTTVLESIALWNECFRKIIHPAGKAVGSVNKGEYRFKHSNAYFPFDEIVSVRSPYFSSIFHKQDKYNEIKLIATFINDVKEELSIGFAIKKKEGNVYDIYLDKNKDFDYSKFNNYFDRRFFPNPINLVFASPVAFISSEEFFVTQPQLADKLFARTSRSVIRNRIYLLSYDTILFERFKDALSIVITARPQCVNFTIESDHRKDSDVRVLFSINNSTAVDLSLMGSGTLQIIEILLAAFSDNHDLGIILLDEPDSHIHRDIQKRLLQLLLNTDKKQIFATTHNESFIRSTSSKNLFHLDGQSENTYYPIIRTDFVYPKIGLIPSKQIKILENLGYENALDFLNALEADKLILVEGDDDARYIQAICDVNNVNKNLMFWSFRGVINIFKNLKGYQAVFENIKNMKTLWEKSILVFDSDYINESQRIKLENSFKTALKIDTFIWSSYTIESTIFEDINKLANIFFTIFNAKGIPIQYNLIYEKINEEVLRFKNEWLDRLTNIQNDGILIDKITSQVSDRREHLVNSYKIDVLSNDNKIITDFLQKKSQLEMGLIACLAKKEDVLEIINKVLISLGVSLDINGTEDLVLLIINNSHLNTFDCWNKMIQLIKK